MKSELCGVSGTVYCARACVCERAVSRCMQNMNSNENDFTREWRKREAGMREVKKGWGGGSGREDERERRGLVTQSCSSPQAVPHLKY